MKARGYYDASAISTIDQRPDQPGRVSVTLSATPGHLYKLGVIAVKAGPTVPPDLIHTNLPLKAGDPIEADRLQGAEANVSLKLPQMRSEERSVGKECVSTFRYRGPPDH